ncbi:MAG: AI-2E family transporter [Saprospiraceae bacterium]|nr:AI-2E family transporter [Saprospiraceae bacterium]
MNENKAHIALDILAVVLIVFIAYMLRSVLTPLIFATILSTLIYPIVHYFETHLYFNRVIAITISILIFCSIIFAIFVFIGTQFNDIMDKSSGYYESITKKLTQLIHHTEKTTGLKQNDILGTKQIEVKEIVKKNSNTIFEFITSSGSIIGDFVLTPLYMFLFLLYRDFLRSFTYRVVAGYSNKIKMKSILNELYYVQHNYLVGLVIVMIIVGLLNSIGLLLLVIEFPFFFGFLCALLLLIPYIGIIIGSILPALVALATKDSYWYAVGVIGIFGFIQFLEGNIITPKITGTKVSLNELVSIISIILFSMLWGIPGMILALPITASLKVIFDHIEQLKPIGFLLGSADDKYYESKAKNRLKTWRKIRSDKT